MTTHTRHAQVQAPDLPAVENLPPTDVDAPIPFGREPSTPPPAAVAVPAAGQPATGHLPTARHVELPPDKIAIVTGRNDRRTFEPAAQTLLGESMQRLDQLQEIIVNRVKGPGSRDGVYELVAGERRLKAALEAGMELIACKAYDGLSETQILDVTHAENIDREDLNHIEQGHMFRRYQAAGMTVPQIVEKFGGRFSDDFVRKHLDLLRLCEPVQALVADGRLPIKQAELIARVGDPAKQIHLTERALDLEWDAKRAAWKRAHQFGRADAERDADPKNPPRDYVMPMGQLRGAVAQAMLGLAACGWPMAEDFAGQRPCMACADNTRTYADLPVLFAGIHPVGSDKKGHCTNEECYRIKAGAWEKVRAARKKEDQAKVKAKIKTAKKAGLDVCAECGRIAQADESFALGPRGATSDERFCAKCREKQEKRAARGGLGGSYEQQQRERKKAEKAFPWTDEQRYALALFDYGQAVFAAIERHLKKLKTDDDNLGNLDSEAAVILAFVVRAGGDFTSEVDIDRWEKKCPIGSVIIDHAWTGAALAEAWNESNRLVDGPGVGWGSEVLNVPLSEMDVAYIHSLELVCQAWAVELSGCPMRPAEPVKAAATPAGPAPLATPGASVPAETFLCNRDCHGCDAKCGTPGENHAALRKAMLVGKRERALPAIERCIDPAALTTILNDPVLEGDWRRAAIRKRLGELAEDAAVEGQPSIEAKRTQRRRGR